MDAAQVLLTALLGCVVLFLGGCEQHSSRRGGIISRADGYDWSLPPSVRETANSGWGWVRTGSGFVQAWLAKYPIHAPEDEIYFTDMEIIVWAQANPEPGVYDWSEVDSFVEQVEAVPHLGFGFYPMTYARMMDGQSYMGCYDGDRRMVPQWVEDQGMVRFTPGGEAAGWESGSRYLEALGGFLRALAERYADHSRFAYIDIRCLDHHWGELWFPTPPGYDYRSYDRILEGEHGLTPAAFETYMNALYDLHAEVFAGQEHKCVIVNFDRRMSGPHQDSMGAEERVWLYGLAKGFGGRDGHVENWMRYLTYGWGSYIDPKDNHLYVDEDWHPAIRDGAVWYTENEEFGRDCNFGPTENTDMRWFASILRALQMRRNMVAIGHAAVWRNEELSRYAQLSMGKTRETSPDAWCWLRECGVHGHSASFPEEKALLGIDRSSGSGDRSAFVYDDRGPIRVKNLERWLMQYDVSPDGMTVPVERIEIFSDAWDEEEHGRRSDAAWNEMHAGASNNEEFWARRTDHAAGQNAMYFRIDPKWYRDWSESVRLYVTYKDADRSEWHIEYSGQDGREETPAVTTGASGETKTVVFELAQLIPGRSFADGTDFRLVRTAGGDAVVHLVRIVKWPPPDVGD
jgi:hypothetical protein